MPPFPVPFIQAAGNVITPATPVFGGQRGFNSTIAHGATGTFTLTLDQDVDAAQSVALGCLASGALGSDASIDVSRPNDSTVLVLTRSAGALADLPFSIAIFPIPVG